MASKKLAAEILDDAAEFVRQGWTKYSPARDRSGRPTPYNNHEACFYCIDGAIARAAFDRSDFVNDVLATRAVEAQQSCRIGTLNDELLRTAEEAVVVLRDAAKSLREIPKPKKPPTRPKKKRPPRRL